MKIETQPLEDQQVKIIVEVEPEQLEEAKHRAARKIAKKAKIPGFRPGKAPYNIVERFAGEAAILEDALDMLSQEMYAKAIDEAGIKPYGPGRLENVTTANPPSFEYVVPLEAEVELGDYQAIREPYEPPVVSEKDVVQVIQNLREQQAIIEPVERAAQVGDQVTIRLSAERKEPAEGENPTLINERSVPVVIRSEQEEDEEEAGMEWPFPGFSKNLIGMNPGEEKTVDYTFPEDTPFEQLQGKEAAYHFVVETVKSRTLPEVNDEFAKSVGDYENLEALRKEIRASLEQQALDEYNSDYDEKVLNQLVSESTVKYPPQMLEQEVHSVKHNLEDRLANQRMDLDTYMKARQIDEEALNQELTPVAETRLKRFLVVFEVAEKEKIQVNPAEVQNEAIQTLNMYASNLPKQEQRKLASQEVITSLVGNITADKMIQKATERLRDIASGKAEEQAASETTTETETEAEQATTVEETSEASEKPEQMTTETTTEASDETSEETTNEVAETASETPKEEDQ